ncbi:hypothetical protein D3C72_448260 [compost metagenome]
MGHASGCERGAVQTAEHGAQQRRDCRWWRDRSRASGAGPGRVSRTAHRHEPGAAQTQQRHRCSSNYPRSCGHDDERRGLSRLQSHRHASGAGLPRTLERGVSGGDGRRCGLAGRDQSACRRHRQHGVCRSGGLPGGADRRHQSWRGFRASGGHAGAAVAERAGAGQRLHHQPFSRRHRLAATRSRLA